MKRLRHAALLVFFMLSLSAQPRSLAQQESHVTKPSPEWKQLSTGVQAATIWDTIGPKWPQTILLQLNNDEYTTFVHDPVRYVNNLKVLGDSSTHRIVFCHKAKMHKGKAQDVAYMVMLLHEPGTVTYVISYEIPPTPPK